MIAAKFTTLEIKKKVQVAQAVWRKKKKAKAFSTVNNQVITRQQNKEFSCNGAGWKATDPTLHLSVWLGFR